MSEPLDARPLVADPPPSNHVIDLFVTIAPQVATVAPPSRIPEVLGVLADTVKVLAGRLRVAEGPSNTRLPNLGARFLPVKAAVAEYPVSRAWLYERGEGLGILRRLPGTRKTVVVEDALRRYLEHGTSSASPHKSGDGSAFPPDWRPRRPAAGKRTR